jgi:transcription elongation factor GreA
MLLCDSKGGVPEHLMEIRDDKLRLRFLRWTRKSQGDGWVESYQDIFTTPGLDLQGAIFSELEGAGATDALKEVVGRVLANPPQSPEAFLWICKAFSSGRIRDLVENPGDGVLLTKLLSLMNQLVLKREGAEGKAAKRSLNRLRSFLSEKKYRYPLDVLARVDREDVKRIYQQLKTGRGATSAQEAALEKKVAERYPEFIAGEAPVSTLESIIWTSRDAFRRKKNELDHVLMVEIPNNQKDIGRAAQFGDLSENAEYTAALERRDFLTKRVGQLQTELKRARIFDPAMARDDMVSVGSKVMLRNLVSGGEEAYIILGPWDADAEHGIISHASPLGKALWGRKEGEQVRVKLPRGESTYEILGIEKAPLS